MLETAARYQRAFKNAWSTEGPMCCFFSRSAISAFMRCPLPGQLQPLCTPSLAGMVSVSRPVLRNAECRAAPALACAARDCVLKDAGRPHAQTPAKLATPSHGQCAPVWLHSFLGRQHQTWHPANQVLVSVVPPALFLPRIRLRKRELALRCWDAFSGCMPLAG